MYYSIKEFIDDNKVIPLQVLDTPSSPNMQEWALKKKFKYLTERKELLYGIWSFEVGGNRYPKNFYRAFANEARLLLLYDHNQMDRLIKFQNEIFEEVKQIQANPKVLAEYYKKHEKQLTLIRYHKDEYIKQRILDYNNLFMNMPSKHKVYGAALSIQSEIRLLYQRTYVENWNTYNRFIDYTLYGVSEKNAPIKLTPKNNSSTKTKQPQSEIEEDYFDEASDQIDSIISAKINSIHVDKEILPLQKFTANQRRSEKKFDDYAQKKIPEKDREKYQREFLILDDKICFWLSLYKDPRVIYSKHYNAFREAINTEIDINELTQKMPATLYQLTRDLVDFKFEKVEFIKNFLQYREDVIVTQTKKDAKKYLDDYWEEIHEIISDKKLTPEFSKRIHDMYVLKSCLLSQSKSLTLLEHGGKK